MSGRRQLIKASWAMAMLCVASSCLPAMAQTRPDLLADISQRLDNPAVLRGDFEQTKTLKGFKRPLVSRGSFVMASGRGVQWVTTQPFASTLVVTRDRLLTLGEGGVTQQIDTKQEPGLRAVNEMLMALLAGDVKALSARFKAEGALQGEHGWHVVLTPRDAALAGFVAKIELDGDRHVKQVVLREASGDDSLIRFSKHTVSTLTPLEIGRFGP
jgi:outer membrane lipoprotein-sorting protein